MTIWKVASVTALQSAVTSAHDGDTVQIKAGTYSMTSSAGILIDKNLTFEGDGGRANFRADVPMTKGIFSVKPGVDTTTFDNIGFLGAHNADKNGAGIRLQGGDLTVKNSYFYHNEDGILGTETGSYRGNVLISNSQFIGNGGANGFSHGIYIGATSLTVENSVFRDTVQGHHIKSVSDHTIVRGNILDDGIGTASREIDVSAGGSLLVEHNQMIKSAKAENAHFILYSNTRGTVLGDVVVQDNTVISHKTGAIFFQNTTTAVATVSDNAFTGITANHVIEGIAHQFGNLLDGVPLLGDILDPNDAPQANAAAATGTEDVALHGHLTATDANGDPLSFALNASGAPVHGDVVIAADGQYTYTPDAGFSGTDSFTYRVGDGHGGFDTAIVSLGLHAVADTPVVTAADTAVGGASTAPKTLIGTNGSETLTGGAGNDVLRGNLGNDTLNGDSAAVTKAGHVAPLTIAAATSDHDGSESIHLTISGVPAGAVLSAGTSLGNGSWSLGLANLSGLTLTLPDSITHAFDLTVTAISTDNGLGDPVSSAPVVSTLTVSPLDVAGGGDDLLVGGGGNDTLNGGGGDDIFQVTGVKDGFDIFHGGDGFDTILGSAGNDAFGLLGAFNAASSVEAIVGNGGHDVVLGSAGNDTMDFSATTLTGIAQIEGGAGKDAIVGSAGNDIIVGGTGNDTLSGGAGNDTFQVAGSADGFDSFQGGAGSDRILGSVGNDIFGLFGTFNAASSVEAIVGNGGHDVIRGSAGNDSLNFSATTLTGIAQIEGGAGKDVIVGSAANNVIVGGTDSDTLTGGGGNDTFAFAKGDGADTVTDFGVGDSLSFSGFAPGNLIVQQVGTSAQITMTNDSLKVTLSHTDANDVSYSTTPSPSGAVVVHLDTTATG